MSIPNLVRETLLLIQEKGRLRKRRTVRKNKGRMSVEIDLLRRLAQWIAGGDAHLCVCTEDQGTPLKSCEVCHGDGVSWPSQKVAKMDMLDLVKEALLVVRTKERLKKRSISRNNKDRRSVEINLLRRLAQWIADGDPQLCDCMKNRRVPLRSCRVCKEGIILPVE